MELKQKILVRVILFLLIINLFLLFSNPKITGFVLSNDKLRAPSDFISEKDIISYDDRIVLEISNYTLSKYTGSQSMVPVFSSSANGVEIKPNNVDDLHVGDIITFREGDKFIAHRIVELGFDDIGWFCITKGDRNNIGDGKIRFDEIEGVLIAIIY